MSYQRESVRIKWRWSILAVVAAFAASCGSSKRQFGTATAGAAGESGEGEAGGSGAGGSAGSFSDSAGVAGVGDEAGEGGAINGSELRVVTGSLPDAMLNTPYTATVVASGGDRDYTFSITSGALPAGLTLDPSGRISGTPTVSGSFDLQLQVADGSGNSTTSSVVLVVDRKRWLAYDSDEETQGQYLLYVVDVSSSLLSKARVSNGLQAKGNVYSWAFAPDGKHLAYTADATTDEQYDLYIVDLSGTTPAAALPVYTAGNVTNFAWSPDSKTLAFNASNGTGYTLRYVDTTSPTPFATVALGDSGAYAIYFITADLLVYSAANGDVTFSRRGTSGFGTPQDIAMPLGVLGSIQGERATFAQTVGPCTSQWTLIDFGTQMLWPGPSYHDGVYSPPLDKFAVFISPNVNVLPAENAATAMPIVTMPANNCLPLVWSQDGSLLISQNNTPSLQLTHFGAGAPVTRTLTGDYGYQSGNPTLVLSDQRLVFSDGTNLFDSDISSGGTSSPALMLNPENVVNVGQIEAFAVSPDSLNVAYTGFHNAGDVPEAYLVGVTNVAQENYHKLNVTITGGQGGVSSLAWSADSAWVGYLATYLSGEVGQNLWLADPLDSSVQPRQLVSTLPCASNTSCASVRTFAFQP